VRILLVNAPFVSLVGRSSLACLIDNVKLAARNWNPQSLRTV